MILLKASKSDVRLDEFHCQYAAFLCNLLRKKELCAVLTNPIHLSIEILHQAELTANGKVCATCRGTFVAVKEGHPAYHRW